jgi:hypothetical protein
LRKEFLREDGENSIFRNSISCTYQAIQQYYGDEMKEDQMGRKGCRLTCERYAKYVQNFSLKTPRRDNLETCRY